MKKIILFATAFLLFSCDNEIEDTINDYKNKPKSEELKGFWQLKGIYHPDTSKEYNAPVILNGGVARIGIEEILYLDNDYLRFLNKSPNDPMYYCNIKERFYWYNEDIYIKSLYEDQYNSNNWQNIMEFKLPYKFGQSKDTLIVQSGGQVLYLTKQFNVEYKEYPID